MPIGKNMNQKKQTHQDNTETQKITLSNDNAYCLLTATHQCKHDLNRSITIQQFLTYQPGGVVWWWYRLESPQPLQ